MLYRCASFCTFIDCLMIAKRSLNYNLHYCRCKSIKSVLNLQKKKKSCFKILNYLSQLLQFTF